MRGFILVTKRYGCVVPNRERHRDLMIRRGGIGYYVAIKNRAKLNDKLQGVPFSWKLLMEIAAFLIDKIEINNMDCTSLS